jgi:2-oxoisovalerate dehydrogenase E1 component beta subunit
LIVDYPFKFNGDEVKLGSANVIKDGCDITIVGWGAQSITNYLTAMELDKELSISTEVIDLSTLVPIDIETILNSISKTGRLIVAHEAPLTSGFAAELTSLVQRSVFTTLKAPVIRCCGYDTPFPLAFEPYYLPNKAKLKDAAIKAMEF